MGQADNNVMMRKNTGMVGGQVVYRNRGGKTVVSNAPKKRAVNSATDRQKVIQDGFGKADRYAKKLKGNPDMKEIYQAGATGGQTAYNIALADAFKAPRVLSINTSAYTGAAGQVIRIEAIDNFRVKEVKVMITDGLGEITEQGQAVESDDTADWLYTTTQPNASFADSVITVTATDLPGNSAVLEKLV